MNMQDLAKHYDRFWVRRSDGECVLADNAPRELWHFVTSTGKTPDVCFEAIKAVATGISPSTPTMPGLLKWLRTSQTAIDFCDEILGAKRPPKDMQQLLERAYKADLFAVVNQAHAFLSTALTKP